MIKHRDYEGQKTGSTANLTYDLNCEIHEN